MKRLLIYGGSRIQHVYFKFENDPDLLPKLLNDKGCAGNFIDTVENIFYLKYGNMSLSYDMSDLSQLEIDNDYYDLYSTLSHCVECSTYAIFQ